jgi:lipopolysaccharide/colanic/teichoic acid biosynthesis glycosyltransferase
VSPRAGFYRRYGKRLLDISVAGVALVLLAPVLSLLALLVRATIGSPVLFHHRRPGLHAKPFVLVKFRTMNESRDAEGRLLPDAARVTHLGRTLRAFSLDELPELYNVLRGDMSLVGPRPLHMHFLERYNADQARRHDVLPGITGWAQVNGRRSLSWERKCDLDLWYVDHLSLALDLRILFMTLYKVGAREGTSA